MFYIISYVYAKCLLMIAKKLKTQIYLLTFFNVFVIYCCFKIKPSTLTFIELKSLMKLYLIQMNCKHFNGIQIYDMLMIIEYQNVETQP